MSATTNNNYYSSLQSTILYEETMIGPYKLIRTIGDGTFSKVMLAQRMDTQEEVAIKIIDRTRLPTNQVKSLYREIAILKKLDHPNIIKLFDVIDSPEKLYLVMEYISGGDLYDYINESNGVTEDEPRAIVRQIVSALEYCHRNGIVHRDLKVENILVDEDLNIKVADFGLSNILAPGEKLTTWCGTRAYCAPELFLGMPYGPEIDVWSLGVILYYLVIGYLPFNDSTLQQTKTEVLRCQYSIPHTLSMDCKDLIKRMLTLQPEKRPNLLAIMEDKWLNYGYEDILKPYVKIEQEQDVNDPV